MALIRRNGAVFTRASDADLQANSGCSVVAYKPGGVVAEASSGNQITLEAGHGFTIYNRLMIGIDSSTYDIAGAVSGNVITTQSNHDVNVGDIVVNLEVDSAPGPNGPNYDGAGSVFSIYSQPNTTFPIINNTVAVGEDGEYRYWHTDKSIWELVLNSSGVPIDIVMSAVTSTSSRVLNVLDYGALGDGITDDSVAIQAALDEVTSSSPAVVYLPAGTYIISQALWIPSYTHLKGDGEDITTIRRQANSLTASYVNTNHILVCGDSSGTPFTASAPGYSITITDLTLDGNYTNQTVSGHYNTHLFKSGQTLGSDSGGNVDGLTIQRVKCVNSWQDGITIYNCKNVLIDSCTTYKTGQATQVISKNAITLSGGGDYATGWCRNAIVTNNRISYSGDPTTRAANSPDAEGIATQGWSNVTIRGNDISYVDYGIELGSNTVHTYDMSNYVVSDNNIHDLSDTNAAKVGITGNFNTTCPLKGLVVSNNALTSIANDGVYIAGATGVVVTGNTLYRTNTSAVPSYLQTGINIVECQDYLVTNNTLIFVSPSANNNGITTQGNTASPGCNYGHVTGNTIVDPAVYGFVLGNSTGATNTHCYMHGNVVKGGLASVRISPNSGTITNCQIYDNHCTSYSSAMFSDAGAANVGWGTAREGSLVSLDTWYKDTVTASLSGTVLVYAASAGTAYPNNWVATRAGSVVGIVLKFDTTCTAGTCTAEVTVNGTGTGLAAVLDAITNPTLAFGRQVPKLDTFSTGDRIGVKITTTGAWLPTTGNIVVNVEVDLP